MDQLIAIWAGLEWDKQVGTALFAIAVAYLLIYASLGLFFRQDEPEEPSQPEQAPLPPAEPDLSVEGLTIVVPGRVLAQRGAEQIGKAVERAIGATRGPDRGAPVPTRNTGTGEI